MRSSLQDNLTTDRFFLLDVAPLDALALPVLTPLFGFTAISGPEWSLDVEEVREGNWPFPAKVIKSGNIGNITLSRGATFFDSDFWRWMRAAAQGDTEAMQSRLLGAALTAATASSSVLSGNFSDAVGETIAFSSAIAVALGLGIVGLPKVGGPTYRRDMLLMQYFHNAPVSSVVSALLFAAGGAISPIGAQNLGLQVALGLATAGRSFSDEGNALAQASQLLPAKAWMLRGCVPIRYKVADFDASSTEISILEMEMAVEDIEEVSLSSAA